MNECLTLIRWLYLFLDAYPWQISFQLKQLGRFSHICGGSVIDEHTVVCAAHCVVGQVEEQVQVTFYSNLYLPYLFFYSYLSFQVIIVQIFYSRSLLELIILQRMSTIVGKLEKLPNYLHTRIMILMT